MLKYFHLTLFVLFACNAGKKERYIYEHSNKSEINNFFNIQNTEYRYRSYPILTIDIPPNHIYYTFTEKSNYIIARENRLDIFQVHKTCEPFYEKNNYAILSVWGEDEQNSFSKGLNPCAICIFPLIDFGIKELDTLKYHAALSNNHWIFLKRKYYKSELDDTLFFFIRKWISEPSMLIVAGKHTFISGIANVINIAGNKIVLSDTLGKIYFKEQKDLFIYDNESQHPKIKLKKPDVDLSKIRELKKCE